MFKKGISGNPNGRPKGSTGRYKLTESMLAKFSEDEVFEVLVSLRNAAISGEVGAAKTFLEFFMVKADKMAEIEAQNQGNEPIEEIKVTFDYRYQDKNGNFINFDSKEECEAIKAKEEKD